MRWQRGRLDRFYLPPAPQMRDRERGEKLVVIGRQKQTISVSPWSPSGSPHALEKRRDGVRRANLDHSVQVANIETKFKRRCRHDEAVGFLDKSRFRLPPLIQR